MLILKNWFSGKYLLGFMKVWEIGYEKTRI